MTLPIRIPLLLMAAAALAGCSNLGRTLGLNPAPPDEFAIVSRAPLEIPENLASLPPPRPGAPRPQEGLAQDRAALELFGAPAVGFTGRAAGESLFLEQAGARANPAIRGQITAEYDYLNPEPESYLLQQLLFWRSVPQRGSAVDAPAEAQRLATNRAQGLPPNYGEVPVIRRRSGSVLQDLGLGL